MSLFANASETKYSYILPSQGGSLVNRWRRHWLLKGHLPSIMHPTLRLRGLLHRRNVRAQTSESEFTMLVDSNS